MEYVSHSRETKQGSPRPRATVLSPGLKANQRGRTRSYKVLANRFTAGGFDLHRRNLHVGDRLAVRLVLAHRTVASPATLPADDSRGLRNAGRVSVDCGPESARAPEPHRFTVWSSVVHAAIMAIQALENPDQIGHLWGDVPALLIVAAVLAVLTPRGTAATTLAAGKK